MRPFATPRTTPAPSGTRAREPRREGGGGTPTRGAPLPPTGDGTRTTPQKRNGTAGRERGDTPAGRCGAVRQAAGVDGGEREREREPPSTVSPGQRQSQTRVLGRGEETERVNARPPFPPPVSTSLSRPPRAPVRTHTPVRTTHARPGERASRRATRATRGRQSQPPPSNVNDPSAGSPTETLLRLLLPLDSQVRPSSRRSARAAGRPRRGRSEGLTKPSNR